jgi:hypothetical protein
LKSVVSQCEWGCGVGPSCMAGWNVTLCSHHRREARDLSGKFIVNWLTVWPSNSTSGYTPQDAESLHAHRNLDKNSKFVKSANNLNVHWWMDFFKCAPFPHWNITQSRTGWDSDTMLGHGRTRCSVRQADTKGPIVCDSIARKQPEQETPVHRKWTCGGRGLGREQGDSSWGQGYL